MGFWTAVFGVAYRVLRYIQNVQEIGHPARRQDARRHPARVPLDPAALEHHHRAVDVLPREGPRPPGRGADRLVPRCTSPSSARPSSTRRGWWGCWRCRSSPLTAWCSPAGRCFRSSRWRRSRPICAAGRGRHDLHRAAGERVPRPPDARAAGAGRARRPWPWWCSCCASSGPSSSRGRRGFRNFVDYLAVLKTPTSPWLPSEWSAEMIMNWLTRVSDPWPIAKLWGGAACSRSRSARGVHRQLFLPGLLEGAGGRRAEGAPAAPRARGQGCWTGCRRRSASSCSRTCGSSSATTPSGAS